MQFTPQQLSGGPKFNPKVKIGNWSEDRSRTEIEEKDYELKKSRGRLMLTAKQLQRQVGTQVVPHSYSADGAVRFGDTVQVALTESAADGSSATYNLANNMWQLVDWGKKSIAVSAAGEPRPVARNTFVITRPLVARRGPRIGAVESKDDDRVLYGQSFYLASNPSLRVDDRTGLVGAPYFLTTEMASTTGGSGKAGRQDVFMRTQAAAACEWKVVAADGDGLTRDGTPVPAGSPVMLVHVVTNQALAASSDEVVSNDFGDELYVHCKTYKREARAAADRAFVALPINRWRLVTSADPAAAVDERGLKPLTPEVLLAKVKETILSRGEHAMRGLSRSFRIMDEKGTGSLDREEFKYGLIDYGLPLSDEEFDMILGYFDRNKDGSISLTEFLVAVRGEMNDRRMGFVHEAFRRLDKDGSGRVTLADLVGVYDASFHPEVKAGTKTQDQVLREFLDQWDTKDKDGIITFDEFTEYYRDLSASVDDDDYWELMMRNAWHISGGEGWAENTTCRRVLVVHTDDSEEVVEIKDDLGVKATDIAGMQRILVAQGVKNIKKISLAD